MRYSSAVVLSTIVVGQAAAANLHNRHASFHARRQAEAKRSPDNNVDWSKVAYDLGDVDWSSVFNTPTPTPTPTPSAATSSSVAEVKAAAVTEVAYGGASSSSVAATSTSSSSSSSSSSTTSSAAAATTTSSSSSLSDAIGDLVSDLMEGVESLASKIGCKTGKNDKSNNGGIWVGSDSQWKAEFTNSGSGNAVLYCWKSDGYSGMIISQNQPEISVGLKPGESVELSFAENVPSACAPQFSDTALAMFGGLSQTWWEVTFGQYGAFDVSRNVNMKGNTIHSEGSKCTSNMDTCVFKCKDSSLSSCETGYDLYNCNASGGGGGGYDAVMQGTGGGCAMGSDGETVKISFS